MRRVCSGFFLLCIMVMSGCAVSQPQFVGGAASSRVVIEEQGVELSPQKAVLSEAELQRGTIKVARAVAYRFPAIKEIGGYRDEDNDHGKGLAIDIMIPGWETGEGKKLGNDVVAYIEANAVEFGVEYMIWQQMYRPFGRQPSKMPDQGSSTLNHCDHVHVTVRESGYLHEGEAVVVHDGVSRGVK